MYKIIRPLLFKLQAETIHHIIINMLCILRYVPMARVFMRAIFSLKSPKLHKEVFGLKFPNPIGLAAGFDKNAEVFDMLGDMGFGFIEIGTVTPKEQDGNPKPRIFRLPLDKGLINRMGFNNKGVLNAASNIRKRKKRPIIGGNIGKNTSTPNEDAPNDYLKTFRALYDYVDYFTVNVSCPNVANLCGLQNKDNTVKILNVLRDFRKGQTDYRPILLKISPDLTKEQVDVMIEVVKECKIDGIVAANTTTSRDGLITDKAIVDEFANGGLSGAPLTNRTLEMVKYIHNETEGTIPIIGVGGIMTAQDAINLMDAGASLVQIYSGFIYDGPMLPRKICNRLITNDISEE